MPRTLSWIVRAGLSALFVLLGPSSFAAPVWGPCKPVEMLVAANRVHARCEQPIAGQVTYVAVSTARVRDVARTMNVIEAAQLGDRSLNVLIDVNDLSGAGFGCATVDCRHIQEIALVDTPAPPLGACTYNTNFPGCPGYCATHPNDTGCPNYCNTHHDDPNCPGYCKSHPSDPDCDVGGQPKACHAKPYLPVCDRN